MAQNITAKQTGKEISIAILTTMSAVISRIFWRKQQYLQLEKMGQVVSSLEDCLRKVEIELLCINDLSSSRIKELKTEKNKLLAEIDAVKRAVGLLNPALLYELERETVVTNEVFYEKRPHLLYYLMVVLVFSFFGYGYFSLIVY